VTIEPARVPVSGSRREVGVLNWVICRLGARTIRAPQFHLFNAIGQHKLLFLAWLPVSGVLLNWGKLSRRDAELVILRVGHLRDSEYELQQHRRLARSRGVDDALQQKIFEGPEADGLSDKQRTLITATDEFVLSRTLTPQTWLALSTHFSTKQLIEFCLLAGQYDTVAATLSALRIPLDFPD
jgi:alkylhydroperoxidase family enzyme